MQHSADSVCKPLTIKFLIAETVVRDSLDFHQGAAGDEALLYVKHIAS